MLFAYVSNVEHRYFRSVYCSPTNDITANYIVNNATSVYDHSAAGISNNYRRNIYSYSFNNTDRL